MNIKINEHTVEVAGQANEDLDKKIWHNACTAIPLRVYMGLTTSKLS